MRLVAGASNMAGETASVAAERRAALLQDDGLASDNEVFMFLNVAENQMNKLPARCRSQSRSRAQAAWVRRVSCAHAAPRAWLRRSEGGLIMYLGAVWFG